MKLVFGSSYCRYPCGYERALQKLCNCLHTAVHVPDDACSHCFTNSAQRFFIQFCSLAEAIFASPVHSYGEFLAFWEEDTQLMFTVTKSACQAQVFKDAMRMRREPVLLHTQLDPNIHVLMLAPRAGHKALDCLLLNRGTLRLVEASGAVIRREGVRPLLAEGACVYIAASRQARLESSIRVFQQLYTVMAQRRAHDKRMPSINVLVRSPELAQHFLASQKSHRRSEVELPRAGASKLVPLADRMRLQSQRKAKRRWVRLHHRVHAGVQIARARLSPRERAALKQGAKRAVQPGERRKRKRLSEPQERAAIKSARGVESETESCASADTLIDPDTLHCDSFQRLVVDILHDSSDLLATFSSDDNEPDPADTTTLSYPLVCPV